MIFLIYWSKYLRHFDKFDIFYQKYEFKYFQRSGKKKVKWRKLDSSSQNLGFPQTFEAMETKFILP
jgi:hypothetical protein